MEEIGQEQRRTLSALRLCCRFKPNDLVINICSCPPVSCSILLGLSPARCSAEKYLRGKTLLKLTDMSLTRTYGTCFLLTIHTSLYLFAFEAQASTLGTNSSSIVHWSGDSNLGRILVTYSFWEKKKRTKQYVFNSTNSWN